MSRCPFEGHAASAEKRLADRPEHGARRFRPTEYAAPVLAGLLTLALLAWTVARALERAKEEGEHGPAARTQARLNFAVPDQWTRAHGTKAGEQPVAPR
jgi:hypothetical protein